LLKLPGRKEQMIGIEEILGPLTDEDIMRHDDSQWNQVIMIAQTGKLRRQQEVIDLENEKKLITRVNELYAVGATNAFEEQEGGKLAYAYIKGDVAITKEDVNSLSSSEWTKKIEEFKNAVIPEPIIPTYNAVRGSHEPIMSPPKITEMSDEEKLFRYATALESVTVPDVKTPEGIEVLKNANKLINEAINLLRK
jgi:hypothetical protein